LHHQVNLMSTYTAVMKVIFFRHALGFFVLCRVQEQVFRDPFWALERVRADGANAVPRVMSFHDSANAFYDAINVHIAAKMEAGEFTTQEHCLAEANKIVAAFGTAAGEAGEFDFPEKFKSQLRGDVTMASQAVPREAIHDAAKAFYAAIIVHFEAKMKAGEFTTEEHCLAEVNKLLAAFGTAAGEAGEFDFPEKFKSHFRGDVTMAPQAIPRVMSVHDAANAFYAAINVHIAAKMEAAGEFTTQEMSGEFTTQEHCLAEANKILRGSSLAVLVASSLAEIFFYLRHRA